MTKDSTRYPLWLRFAYWLDYTVLKCRWDWFCLSVDGWQWLYRKKATRRPEEQSGA